MDIYDIKIEEITKQYVDFINKMKDMNLDVASEYLVMASELIELKSERKIPYVESQSGFDGRILRKYPNLANKIKEEREVLKQTGV